MVGFLVLVWLREKFWDVLRLQSSRSLALFSHEGVGSASSQSPDSYSLNPRSPTPKTYKSYKVLKPSVID